MGQKMAVILLAGFIGGVLLRSFLNFGWAFAGFFLLLAAIFILVRYLVSNTKIFLYVAIFLIAGALGMARYEIKDAPPALSRFESAIARGGHIELDGFVVDEPDDRENYPRLVV